MLAFSATITGSPDGLADVISPLWIARRRLTGSTAAFWRDGSSAGAIAVDLFPQQRQFPKKCAETQCDTQCGRDGSSHAIDFRTAVPRRAYRQPDPATGTAGGTPAAHRRRARSRRTARGRGRRHRHGGEDAGGDRPAGRDRRRVPARHLFRQLHQRRARRRRGQDDGKRGLGTFAEPRPPHGAPHPRGHRPHRMEGTAERGGLQLSAIAHHAHGQDHPARPLLHPLPRRTRQYQPRGLSRPRRLLVRSRHRLCAGDELARRGRLPLPADRRDLAGQARRSARADTPCRARRRLARPPARLYRRGQRGRRRRARRT